MNSCSRVVISGTFACAAVNSSARACRTIRLCGRAFHCGSLPITARIRPSHATASAVAGEDLSGFFAEYVAARETLPVEECLRTLGYTLYAKQYAGEAYLAPADSAALEAWLGVAERR